MHEVYRYIYLYYVVIDIFSKGQYYPKQRETVPEPERRESWLVVTMIISVTLLICIMFFLFGKNLISVLNKNSWGFFLEKKNQFNYFQDTKKDKGTCSFKVKKKVLLKGHFTKLFFSLNDFI